MEWHLLFLGYCSMWIASTNGQDYRLPETVVPSRYVVDLFVPEGVFTGTNDTFEGEATMTFSVTSNVTEIKLHHRLTTISVVVGTSTQNLSISNTSYDSVTEILTITLGSALTVGTTYNLYTSYYGIFERDNMRGFYISTYADENNQTSYLVLSKFEPVHSRHAFPCLDEPQYKATFQLSLTYPNNLNALANTPIVSNTTISSTYIKSTYRETTKMSTYLLAFAISHFTCTEGYTIENGVSHSVCSRPEEAANRAFAVDYGTSVLRTLESITGIKYGTYMPKMDQLAIPDFASGAMENWGLVSYRETYLLWDEEESSNSYKKGIALVVAHEFTHSWYGNLVTCKWWDYTFLNEGFARYYQYFAAAATQQSLDWELDKHFNVEVVHVALLADSTRSALALTSDSYSPSDIAGKFSTISYSKGASILRMIEKSIMGSENFVFGLRHYLSANAQQATVPADLWSALSGHVPSSSLPAGTDLSTVINNWVEMSGHPVVVVTRNGSDIVLSQQRFLLTGSGATQYYVPITLTVSSDITAFWNTTVQYWLVPGQNLTIPNVLNDNTWFILNNRQAGFYRVDYDNATWTALKSQLHSNYLSIDVLNRAQLVSDAYNFARSGHNTGYGNWTYADTLDLLKYLHYETEYYPWYAAIVGHNHLLQRIGYDTTVGKRFTSWMLGLMEPVNRSISFDINDASNQVYSMKQSLIYIRTCKYGDAYCIGKAKELFASYRVNGTRVPKNLKVTVYCNALRHSDDIERDFNFLWRKYTETKLMTEIITIFNGLSCAEDSASLKWFLNQTINATSGIRLQDFTSVWSYVYSSGKVGTNAAIEYITENYAQLTAAYGSVGSLISNAANYIYASDQLEKLEALANVPGISSSHLSTTNNALSTAKSNIEWAETVAANIEAYFDSLESSSSKSTTIPKTALSIIIILIFLQKLL